jgi:hypothetical protein
VNRFKLTLLGLALTFLELRLVAITSSDGFSGFKLLDPSGQWSNKKNNHRL